MEQTTNKGGAPLGNQNARVGGIIRGVIRRVLAEHEAQGRLYLERIVTKMLDEAEKGEPVARRELFDRLDGKPTQPISGDEDRPPAKVEVSFVKPG